MISKEQIALRLLSLMLAGVGLGIGLSELGQLTHSKRFQDAVEFLKQPEKAFQTQPQKTQPQQPQKHATSDKFLLEPPIPFYSQDPIIKPIDLDEICKYYPDATKCIERQKLTQKEVKHE